MKARPARILQFGALVVGLTVAGSTLAKEIKFAGSVWTVRSGQGGPGPNRWSEDNVWLDAQTNLHLRISHRDGQWSCAEIIRQERSAFGRYQFQTTGRLDRFDDNVVLGLFNYPTSDVGPDGTHEIDIEFARWGDGRNPMGNFTVWPVEHGHRQVTRSFAFTLTGDDATHRIVWRRDHILFESVQDRPGGTGDPLAAWTYRPLDPPRFIAQKPMPVHVNLWLFQGRPPKDGREVEVIIRDFRFWPEGESTK